MEDSDHKFASRMRSHRKQVVLKDDEVERIERAASAACPTYSLEERQHMAERAEQDAEQERRLTRDQKIWAQIELPNELGVDCDGYKWRQSQSHVEVFVKLPTSVVYKKVTVSITMKRLQVSADGNHLAGGALIKTVIPSSSTWQLIDNIVEISLLKANRRGLYAPGTTHSDTYWDRVWEGCLESDRLTSWAPTKYYSSPFEDDTINYAALEAAEKDVERTRQQALLAVS